MLLDRYNLDALKKVVPKGTRPLIITNENPRKAVFEKLNRAGGIAQAGRSKKRLTRHGLMARGNSFVGQRYGQRVVVKIRFVKHKPGLTSAGGGASALRDHLRYVSRSGAGKDGIQAVLFNGQEEGVGKKDFLTLCEGDRHHFRFIISPENGHDIPDFHIYVRGVMELVEKDLKTKLEWVSAVHYDTDDPHAHVIVRGKTDSGKDLVIGQDYIKEGVRKRAQEVATELLGERSLEQIQKSLEKEVDALRVTSLDRFIEKQAQASEERQVDVRKQVNFGKSVFYEGLLKGRLKFLGAAGLAQEHPPGIYALKEDYQDVLTQIASRNDAVKKLQNKIDVGLDGLTIYSLKDGQGPTIEGRVVAKGIHNELYDSKFVVVKEGNGQLHYVPAGEFRRYDELEDGSVIQVRPGKAGTGRADHNIAQMAGEHGGVYDPSHHMAHVEKNQSYIPPEQRSKYLEAHATRLSTLEESGVVEPLGDGRYKIPADVIARGEEITRQINEREKKRFYPVVSVLSATPPEKHIEAAKKTWLDKELYKQLKGKGASGTARDPVIQDALKQRKDWLLKHDLAFIQSNGEFAMRDYALPRLDKLEVYTAGRKLAEKLDVTFNDTQVQIGATMRYEGFVTLQTGVWAVAVKGQSLQLAPLSEEPKLNPGSQVAFEPGENKKLTMKSVEQRKIQDKGQDRGL